jgi:hypothetical protein
VKKKPVEREFRDFVTLIAAVPKSEIVAAEKKRLKRTKPKRRKTK